MIDYKYLINWADLVGIQLSPQDQYCLQLPKGSRMPRGSEKRSRSLVIRIKERLKGNK